jgi:hypothetical protein
VLPLLSVYLVGSVFGDFLKDHKFETDFISALGLVWYIVWSNIKAYVDPLYRKIDQEIAKPLNQIFTKIEKMEYQLREIKERLDRRGAGTDG